MNNYKHKNPKNSLPKLDIEQQQYSLHYDNSLISTSQNQENALPDIHIIK